MRCGRSNDVRVARPSANVRIGPPVRGSRWRQLKYAAGAPSDCTPMTVTARRCALAATRTAYVATDGVTARNLRARPRAVIECDDYFEDWSRLRGVVARARAKVITRGAQLERARRLLKRKFRQYRDYEFESVIALRIERITSWGLS